MNQFAASLPGHPVFRAVRDADGAAVAELIAACFAEYPGCLFCHDEFPELQALAAWASARGTLMWVLDAEAGTIAACICATPAQGNAVELHKFYVTSTLRGTGLARHMLGLVLDVASAQGASSVFLWSDTRFVRAHRFYEKAGFVRQPGQRQLHDISNTEEYHYRLAIGAAP
ncbi:MAG: GNAT family N-acetyltransferase [Beijerinckiaceae bacterium]|jgi:putative acetyltransferase|nr:GNAT family N-acetyltransferase [Beijerinckiaceae bacterium]